MIIRLLYSISRFKQNKTVVGFLMSNQDVKKYFEKLDAKQDDALEKAMDELKKDGLLETQEDGFSLVLTQKGANTL